MIKSRIKQYKQKNNCDNCNTNNSSSSSSSSSICSSSSSSSSSSTSCIISNDDIKIISNTPIYDISGNCSNCNTCHSNNPIPSSGQPPQSISNSSINGEESTIGSSTISDTIYSSSYKSSINPLKNIPSTYVPVTNKVVIDVAVLCQEYTAIEKMCNDHIINLDEIEITKQLFQYIFYPFCDNFGINKNTICNNCTYLPYISFLPEYRTVNGKKFYLLEEIISNIETDLNISRNCFTMESLVELTNEITSIRSLCDLNCCSVLASLTWCNILEIVKNYNLINYDCDCSIKPPVIPIFAISVIFKTPTPHVKNTIVRFNYRITDL